MRFIVVRTSLTDNGTKPNGFVVVDTTATTSYPYGKVVAECGDLLGQAQAVASAMNAATP